MKDVEMDKDLKENDFIIERKGKKYEWIFKNDNNLISFLK
jgi:hypothetical protein